MNSLINERLKILGFIFFGIIFFKSSRIIKIHIPFYFALKHKKKKKREDEFMSL